MGERMESSDPGRGSTKFVKSHELKVRACDKRVKKMCPMEPFGHGRDLYTGTVRALNLSFSQRDFNSFPFMTMGSERSPR